MNNYENMKQLWDTFWGDAINKKMEILDEPEFWVNQTGHLPDMIEEQAHKDFDQLDDRIQNVLIEKYIISEVNKASKKELWKETAEKKVVPDEENITYGMKKNEQMVERLERLTKSDTCTSEDNILIQKLLKDLGFTETKIIVGLVYLDGIGEPISIHKISEMILKILQSIMKI